MYKQRKKIMLIGLLVIVIGWLTFLHFTEDNTLPTVAVSRGTIIEKALAVGNIMPRHSITVTSTIAGTAATLFHEEGDAVAKGNILLEIKPNPRPIDLDTAKRELQQKQVAESREKAHVLRLQNLFKQDFITKDDYEQAQSSYQTAVIQRQLAEEQLALLEKGRAIVAGQVIQSVITSPIDGYILSRQIAVGDPVVPQTDSQTGNTLFTIADMKNLIFKGQVNEIDIAKLKTGMLAEITVGGFPEKKLIGKLQKLALQSAQAGKPSKNASGGNSSSSNAAGASNSPFNVGFEVEISDLKIPAGLQLRSGYSANAEITIQRLDKILMIPERVVVFEGKKTFVWLAIGKRRQAKKQEVALGLSDGINIQVIAGLKEGQKIFEHNPTEKNNKNNVENN